MSENELASKLLSARDYREFLALALGQSGFGGRRPNFAAFARKAGFSSRAYPRDVVSGKKRVTPASLPAFLAGLKSIGVSKDGRQGFRFLVMLEEPDTNSENLSAETLNGRLEVLRRRAQARPLPATFPRSSFAMYRDWAEIYAALGTPEAGSTLAAIAARAGLPLPECRTALDQMLAKEVIRFDAATGRYHSLQLKLDLSDSGRDRFFKWHFERSLTETTREVRSHFGSPDRLFLESVFAIDRSRAAAFKQELRELILRFVDQAERPDGDALAKLLISFAPLSRRPASSDSGPGEDPDA